MRATTFGAAVDDGSIAVAVVDSIDDSGAAAATMLREKYAYVVHNVMR